jgi:signal transduction histidine kinase/CheY-like chemotaxis protein/GAF domain-containing protein
VVSATVVCYRGAVGEGRSSEHEISARALEERIKELTLLHRTSRLLESGRAPDAALVAEIVALLPAAWQFPALCEARLQWTNIEVRTPGWRETPWRQSASFAAGAEAGVLEVVYREAPGPGDAFLPEEHDLIASVAEMIGASFGRARAEQLAREREERLTFLYELSEAIRGVSGVDELLPIVVERLGRQLRASRCAVAHVDPDGIHCSVPYDYTDGCASLVGSYELTAFGAASLSGATAPLVVRDVAAEFPPEAAAKNRALDVGALIVASHVTKGGALRALMAVQQRTPRDWTDHEVRLVAETFARTWANIEQRAAEAKLRQRDALLRIAGETARLGGWSIDLPDGRIAWSDEVCALHQVPAGTAPTAEEALAFYPPEHRPGAVAALAACLRDGTPFDVELEVVGAEGRRVWARASGRAERDAKGAIVRVQGALQDVSDRKRLEEHLRQAQKMEAIGQLAAGVAHDFNNILSVILNYASIIIDDLPDGHELRGDAEQIHAAGLRAADLTRQLLTFSRQQALQAQRVDLAKLVGDLEKMLRRLLGERVRLAVHCADGRGDVFVDPGQLEQVVMNLVVNARDAMPNGGSVTIDVAPTTLDDADALRCSVAPGRYVMLSVRDTGQGMDAATRERIFEPFFTTKDKGKGTGLGLATVYGIVTQSGGGIEVHSEPGAGTVFNVYFRRLEQDAAGAAAEPPPQPTTLRGTETILLVEDAEAVRAVARATLRRAGYQVLEAQNAGEALLVSEQHPATIHLLLTDVVMPHLSGPRLAERLLRSRPETRVLYVSGSPDAAGEVGADAFLPKPFAPEALLVRVREVLDADPTSAGASTEVVEGAHILHVDGDEVLVQLTARVLKRIGYRVSTFTSPTAALAAFRDDPDSYQAIVTDIRTTEMSGFDLVREARKTRPRIAVVLTSDYFRDADVRSAAALGLRALVAKSITVEVLGRTLHEELRRRLS